MVLLYYLYITVNVLYANLISANRVTVVDVLAVSTASFTSVTVDNKAMFGRLGIGVEEPLFDFHVDGSSYFNGGLSIDGVLSADSFYSESPITFNFANANDTLIFDGLVSVNASVAIKESLQFSSANEIALSTSHGQLFGDANGDIIYQAPNSTDQINLLSGQNGEVGRLSFYGDSGGLSDSADLF